MGLRTTYHSENFAAYISRNRRTGAAYITTYTYDKRPNGTVIGLKEEVSHYETAGKGASNSAMRELQRLEDDRAKTIDP